MRPPTPTEFLTCLILEDLAKLTDLRTRIAQGFSNQHRRVTELEKSIGVKVALLKGTYRHIAVPREVGGRSGDRCQDVDIGKAYTNRPEP